jgi:hypothetical protein
LAEFVAEKRPSSFLRIATTSSATCDPQSKLRSAADSQDWTEINQHKACVKMRLQVSETTIAPGAITIRKPTICNRFVWKHLDLRADLQPSKAT